MSYDYIIKRKEEVLNILQANKINSFFLYNENKILTIDFEKYFTKIQLNNSYIVYPSSKFGKYFEKKRRSEKW